MQARKRVKPDDGSQSSHGAWRPRRWRVQGGHRIVLAAVVSGGLIAMSIAESPDAAQSRIEAELATIREERGELRDREDIRLLAVSYGPFARTRKIEELVALYSSDAAFEVAENMGTTPGLRSGRDAIRETLRVDLPRADPWPFLHQHYIELLGHDRARGVLYFELRQGVENLRTTHIGSYVDEYVKEGGAWRFRSRKLAAVPLPAAVIPGT